MLQISVMTKDVSLSLQYTRKRLCIAQGNIACRSVANMRYDTITVIRVTQDKLHPFAGGGRSWFAKQLNIRAIIERQTPTIGKLTRTSSVSAELLQRKGY